MSTAQERIKAAFLRLLGKNEYSKISVTQICREAGVSRVTFYIWYEGKDGLMDDFLRDMADDGINYYRKLKSGSQEDTINRSYHNLLDTIFYLYKKYSDFMDQIYENNETSDQKIYNRYHSLVMEQISALTAEYSRDTLPPVTTRELISFLVNGLSSMIQMDIRDGMSMEDIRIHAGMLLDRLLDSGLFA